MKNKKFYTFIQNYNNDFFESDNENGICEVVIIEALSSDHANERALEIGLYFYGVVVDNISYGFRWFRCFDDDGMDEPMIFDIPIEIYKCDGLRERCFIHYVDGSVKECMFKK